MALELEDKTATPAPAAAAGDLSQGYCVKLYVLPTGSYGVGAPSALEAGEDYGEEFPTVGAALKGVLDVIKQNPTGDDAGQQLEAGYGAR